MRRNFILVLIYRMPCPYASALGVPGEGFHEARMGGFAFNDVIGTVALAGMTTHFTGYDFKKSLLGWFVVAEAMHYAFGVDTAFLKMVGVTPRTCGCGGSDCQKKSGGCGCGK